MRTLTVRLLTVALVGGLALAGCHKKPQKAKQPSSTQPSLAVATSAPQAAVQSAIKQLQAGHFDRLAQLALPPPAFHEMRSTWTERQQLPTDQITQKDREHFAKSMHDLTAPDAKKKLFAKLQPALDSWDSKYKARLPMMVGILRIGVGTEITKSDSMTGAQKSQARGVLDALSDWALDTNWGDKVKAKQAVGIVVDSARALDLKTLNQAYHLNYKDTMQRYGTVWNGAKKLLDVYGLSMDKVLDSAKVKTLSQKGAAAKVEVDYSILGKPMTSTFQMVRKGKRWYLRNVLGKWHKEKAKLAAAASAAHAASVAPAASTAPSAAASAP